jgi:hypothetical protein
LKRKGNKTTNKEENKNKGDLKKQKQRRLEKKKLIFHDFTRGRRKETKETAELRFPAEQGGGTPSGPFPSFTWGCAAPG